MKGENQLAATYLQQEGGLRCSESRRLCAGVYRIMAWWKGMVELGVAWESAMWRGKVWYGVERRCGIR